MSDEHFYGFDWRPLILKGTHRRTGAMVFAEAPTGDQKEWKWQLRLPAGNLVALGAAPTEASMMRAAGKAIKTHFCNARTKMGKCGLLRGHVGGHEGGWA